MGKIYICALYFIYYNTMINDVLEQHWLTKVETKTYLAALELWTAPVSKIARKAGESRESMYYILENLEKKWFIKSVIMNKVKNYFAISPEELLNIQKWKIEKLVWAMPELIALRNWGENKPKVSLFEWSEWLKFLYQDTIRREWSEIKAFLWHTNTDKYLQKYLNTVHIKERQKNNVNAKILMPIGMANDKWYEPNDNKTIYKLTEIKYIQNEKFNMYNEIDLYDENKIWIMLYGTNEMFGLLIESKSIYNMLASLFDLLRENGKY